MKNVTITLSEEVARWARLEAARRDSSVSRLVGEMLEEKMARDEGRRAAEEQFFSVAPRVLRREGEPLPSREELHDRAGLR
ncbi:MAG: hypothetical protein R3244_03480 [Thermoanaerobaculia bacterium]|nr:hypothetical protein [Thermoanaerobaculia bacterium]